MSDEIEPFDMSEITNVVKELHQALDEGTVSFADAMAVAMPNYLKAHSGLAVHYSNQLLKVAKK